MSKASQKIQYATIYVVARVLVWRFKRKAKKYAKRQDRQNND